MYQNDIQLSDDHKQWLERNVMPVEKPGQFTIYTAAIVLITATIQFVTVSGL